MHVSSYCYMCVLVLLVMYRYMCPYSSVSALVLLCACPHTAIGVLILLYICSQTAIHVCPHPAKYVPSSCYMCVLILKYLCGRGFSERLGLVYCLGQDTRNACNTGSALFKGNIYVALYDEL